MAFLCRDSRILLALFSVALSSQITTRLLAASQDLLNDALEFSGAMLHLRPYVRMPSGFNDIISMTTRPGDTRLYVTTQEGRIFVVDENPGGTNTTSTWFDVAAALSQATNQFLFGNSGHEGLQSTAFHPDFDQVGTPGYGKFYTTLMETKPGRGVDTHYLGNPDAGDPQMDSVLAEWTFNHETQQVDPASYRELFRVSLPVRDHMIKQARFNPYAEPGDEDYGLLYVTHGDSSSQQSAEDRPQKLDEAFGKMFRIDPLQAGADPYTIPASNPFFGNPDPSVLQEIYAFGFRNPHNFSFNQDDQGNIHILVGDIGRSNIEEVNLVAKGGNYGWTKREGTFVHLQGTDYTPPDANAGYVWGVTALPADEATSGVDAAGNNYIYPVAQWDHNDDDVNLGDDYTATAIASGFLIRNGSDPALHNQFIHNNFAFNHGDVYQSDFEEILNAVTQLDANDPTRDEPDELTQAEVLRLHLALDHDNDPSTAELLSDDLNELLGTFRNDARFGEGLLGEMYISTKWNNVRTVYLVSNTLPYDADFDGNGIVDGTDFLVWQRNAGAVGYESAGDANHDCLVNDVDLALRQQQHGTLAGQTLISSTIPEPSALALMFSGLVGFRICFGRKSR